MKHSPAKVNILKKIRKALRNRTPIPYPKVGRDTKVFPDLEGDAEIRFVEAFKKAGGKFLFCDSQEEAHQKIIRLSTESEWEHLYCWNRDIYNALLDLDFRKCRIGKNLDKADCGLFTCEALIAQTGSIMISSTDVGGRAISIVPPVSIVIANQCPILENVEEGIEFMMKKYKEDLPGSISLITGPSKTLAFEYQVHVGAVGSAELFLFYID